MSTTGKNAAPSGRTHVRHRREHRRTHTAAFVLGATALWLYLGFVMLHLLHNNDVLPAWVFVGAAVVPVTLLWVMVHRLRVTDTLTWGRLAIAAGFGGLLALALGSTLDSLTGFIPQPHPGGDAGVVSLAAAGFVEEFAKGVLIVVVGWRVVKSTRNGLFVGGAVGIGFSVYETMGYILGHYGGDHPVFIGTAVAIERGILAPFGHVLWSSLLGAALFTAAAKTGRFRVTGLVLGAYVGVAVLHGLWDGASPLVTASTGSQVLAMVTEIGAGVVTILAGGLIWRHVARSAPAPADAPDDVAATTDAVSPAPPPA
ncbi:PrsW family intramembrane metalloprotease [Microbacterium trichothecenolyticum]|uniref:RsiW-degrading membrane proteinase PrsW (M82 family) n=1 Tax=Microbacterium trichothecenolyticum TaxID=69370 RepID=A0ABU0TXL9_MICTR|nr:PrsW family glutamic-type intramembrane protease [Microbacterium trichothecenolyticum]MDQ1124388.1 RsiW-degrading membrane proteinase PrsW (M82 family) [Microbacterium trichothecenolyticum]